MQLVLAIVQPGDADVVCQRLNRADLRVTRFASAGAFLARGSVTILVGVADERVPEVTEIIRATCRARRGYVTPLLMGADPAHAAVALAQPLETELGGATVFCLPVRRFVRLRGGGVPLAAEAGAHAVDHPVAGDSVNMILAIVQDEDAGAVVDSLVAFGHRLTRIHSTGAFLRRGSTTLAIGVRADHVDEVLELIQAACKLRAEAGPVKTGMPMFSATVFVLEAAVA